MTNVIFKRLNEATAEAANDIARLLPQLSSRPLTFTVDDLCLLLSQPLSYVYVVEADGHIIGMLTFVGYRIPTGVKFQLEDVVLDNAYRGQGIARRFMTLAIEDFRRSQPTASVALTSRPSRVAANALYRSLGFKQKETNNYTF